MATLTDRDESLFIDGRWRRPVEAREMTVIDPSTARPITQLAGASPVDVASAVAAACAAFDSWRRVPCTERAALLRTFSAGLQRRRAALVHVQMLNNGKPRREADIDLADAIATFDYYASLAEDLDTRQGAAVATADAAFTGHTHFEPLGPAGLIVPWNFPLVTSAWKLAPALAAGCTVVLKTSEYTPLAELAYSDIAEEAGLPAGVLNIVTGDAIAGAALATDTRLRKISFTGSNAVGAKVMSAAAARCAPVALELGGKSPIVVFADYDVEHAVELVTAGIFYNCGQMCSATSRLLVERQGSKRLMEALVERTNALRVGNPFSGDIEMGPLTTARQHDKVLAIFERARADRLRCLTGGAPLDHGAGFFVAPTIYAGVSASHPLWREEVFGPVLCVTQFEDEREAVDLANDTCFGLAATVVSADEDRARRVAASIDADHIWINVPQVIFPNTAWGGFKSSGIGRELGPWGLEAFLGVKHITAPTSA